MNRKRDSLIASWGPRPPDVPRTARFLRELSTLPGWHPLRLLPPGPQEQLRPLDLDDDTIARLLAEQRDHDDFGHLMPGTGSNLHVWNGVEGNHHLSAYLRLGETRGPLGNLVSIKVPVVPTPGTSDEAAAILRLVVNVWRPDHAWTGPIALAFSQEARGTTTVGRLTYVPHQDPLPPLPEDVTGEPFAAGTLLTIQASGDELAGAAFRLSELLAGSGVLSPEP